MNRIVELEKFEPESTFENTINEIKSNCLQIITSIDMNLSDITSNKPSLSSEHPKSYLMPCIFILSTENYHNSSNIFLWCTLN